MSYVSTHDKMPKNPHWAIITFESMWIEGDERSRTNPGHGYPGHSENYVSYRAFTDEAEWKREVAELAAPKYGSPKPYMAAYVTPAKVATVVNVTVDVPK
jgi:hypothetical protein